MNLARDQHQAGIVDADIQMALGVLFYQTGEFERARDCWVSALSVRPNVSTSSRYFLPEEFRLTSRHYLFFFLRIIFSGTVWGLPWQTAIDRKKRSMPIEEPSRLSQTTPALFITWVSLVSTWVSTTRPLNTVSFSFLCSYSSVFLPLFSLFFLVALVPVSVLAV